MPVAEDEPVTGERLLTEAAADELGKPVEPTPHVGRSGGQEDAGGGAGRDHEALPNSPANEAM